MTSFFCFNTSWFIQYKQPNEVDKQNVRVSEWRRRRRRRHTQQNKKRKQESHRTSLCRQFVSQTKHTHICLAMRCIFGMHLAYHRIRTSHVRWPIQFHFGNQLLWQMQCTLQAVGCELVCVCESVEVHCITLYVDDAQFLFVHSFSRLHIVTIFDGFALFNFNTHTTWPL